MHIPYKITSFKQNFHLNLKYLEKAFWKPTRTAFTSKTVLANIFFFSYKLQNSISQKHITISSSSSPPHFLKASGLDDASYSNLLPIFISQFCVRHSANQEELITDMEPGLRHRIILHRCQHAHFLLSLITLPL